MRYEIRVWNLDEDEQILIKCQTKNQVIDNLMDLALSGIVEDISVFDTVKGASQ